MIRISIISLIYKSTRLADWVYGSIHKYTPMLRTGEAEFYFVANDASMKVIEHLKSKSYMFYEFNNKKYSDCELFKMGFSYPEYMRRVYRGYNYGILKARGQIVVLVNSDNFFSKDWLENLLKYYDNKKIISSQLVEPRHKKHDVFESAIHQEFGSTSNSFDENAFATFVERQKVTGVYVGGAYMPCMIDKNVAIYSGLYPSGNIAGRDYKEIKKTGDVFFFEKLKEMGVEHLTSMDSIVYHLKEGEMDEGASDDQTMTQDENEVEFSAYSCIRKVAYGLLQPNERHQDLVNKLMGKPVRRRQTLKARIARILYRSLPRNVYDYIIRMKSAITKNI